MELLSVIAEYYAWGIVILMAAGTVVLIIYMFYSSSFKEICTDEYKEIDEIYKNTSSKEIKELIEKSYKKDKINVWSYEKIKTLYDYYKKENEFNEAKSNLVNKIKRG